MIDAATPARCRRSQRRVQAAGAGFVVLLAGAMAAGAWFAVRDAKTAKLALEELTEKPLARVEGADAGTGYAAYSVQPPAVVEAVLAGAVTSASLTSSTAQGRADGAATQQAPGADGYLRTSFKVLAGFDYGMKAGEAGDGTTSASTGAGRVLPPEVQALDGNKVSVTGFMMPIDFEGGRVRSFLLMKNQLLCCFGIAPRLNDFVAVQVRESRGVPAVQDVAITAKGILQVGEVSENGVALAVYTMIADDVKAVKQAW